MDAGLFFVSHEDGASQTVRFLDFRTRRVEPLFSLEKQRPGGGSLALSRDGRFAVATRLDHAVSELMMIEHFR